MERIGPDILLIDVSKIPDPSDLELRKKQVLHMNGQRGVCKKNWNQCNVHIKSTDFGRTAPSPTSGHCNIWARPLLDSHSLWPLRPTRNSNLKFNIQTECVVFVCFLLVRIFLTGFIHVPQFSTVTVTLRQPANDARVCRGTENLCFFHFCSIKHGGIFSVYQRVCVCVCCVCVPATTGRRCWRVFRKMCEVLNSSFTLSYIFSCKHTRTTTPKRVAINNQLRAAQSFSREPLWLLDIFYTQENKTKKVKEAWLVLGVQKISIGWQKVQVAIDPLSG